MIVCDRQDELGEWLCSRTGGKYVKGSEVYIGLETEGKIVAVAGYADFNGASIRVHLAVDGKITPEFLWYGFHYPFEELKVKKLIGLVSSNNKKALRLDKHFGYVEEAVIKDAVPEGDLHILTMTKEQCRFLRKDHGFKI
jgi:RimJ/RimL family protein N-acetyltransferase